MSEEQPRETRVSATSLITVLTQLLEATEKTNSLLQSQNIILNNILNKDSSFKTTVTDSSKSSNTSKPTVVNQLPNAPVIHPQLLAVASKRNSKTHEQHKIVRELHNKYPNLTSGHPAQDEDGFVGLTPPEWQNQEVPVKDANSINPTMYR